MVLTIICLTTLEQTYQGRSNSTFSSKPEVKTAPSVNYAVVMTSAATLNSDCDAWGCRVSSAANGYFLIMQHDCALILYDAQQAVKWQPTPSTWRGGTLNCYLAAQANGQLVVYRGDTNVALWQSNSAPATPAASYQLTVTNDGFLVWAENTAKVIWTSNPQTSPTPFTKTTPSVNYAVVIPSGATLNSDCDAWGCRVSSAANGYFLIMQHDCALILRDAQAVKWQPTPSTWRGGKLNCYLAAQANGQLAVYRGDSNVALWQSNPAPTTPAASYQLTVTNDGNLVWADNTGKVIWSAVSTVAASAYEELETALIGFIGTDANKVKNYLRLAWHDVKFFDPVANPNGGGKGCIMLPQIAELPSNSGLGPAIVALRDFIAATFPTIAYTWGDIVSLAGKVAVETAYGVNVSWSYGRKACVLASILTTDNGIFFLI